MERFFLKCQWAYWEEEDCFSEQVDSGGGIGGCRRWMCQGQAVRTPCGPAVSQAVGASFAGGKQQRSLLSKGTGASPAGRHGPPDHDTTMREMASSRGLNPPWRNGVTIASGTKPGQTHNTVVRSFGGGGKGGDPARRTGKGKGKAVSAPRPPGKFHAGPLTRQSPQGSPSHPQPRPPQSMRVVAGWCQECVIQKKNLISVFQLLCVNRKCNLLLYKE